MPKSHVVTVHSAPQQPLPVSRTDQIKFYFKAGALLLATTAMYAAARATRLLPQWQSSDSSPTLPNAALQVSELSNNQEQTAQLPLAVSTEEEIKKEANQEISIKNAANPIALSGLTDFQEIQLDTSHISEKNTHKRKLLQTSNGPIVVANPIPDQTAQVGNTYTYDLGEAFSGDYTILGAIETGKNSLPSWLNLECKKLGSYTSPSAYGVAISGDTAFIVNSDSSVYILNVSDLTNPTLLSTYQAGIGRAHGIAASGNTVFIANKLAGLHIVDVSNLTNPQLLSTYPIIGDGSGATLGGVAVSGNTVFITNFNAGLQILDVSNRTNPNLLSVYPSIYAFGVTVSGNTVFLAAYITGLQILNVSNPRNPQLLSTYSPGAGKYVLSVAVSGNTAFVAINPAGLQTLNISNLATPKLLTTYPISSTLLYNVVSLGNTIFVGGASLDLQILDISDPLTPKLIGIGKSNSAYVFNIALSENIAFMAANSAGLQILDLTQGRLIGIPGISEAGQRFSITAMVRNETAEWIANTFSLTLNNPPRLAQNALTDQSVFPNQSLILSFDSEQLFINPSASFLRLSMTLANGKPVPNWLTFNLLPTLLSAYPESSNGLSHGITVVGSTAYMANYYGGLQIIDVSDLTLPRLLSNYPSNPGSGNAWNTVVLGNTLFMADYWGGVHILNISIPTNPQLLGTYGDYSLCVLDVAISGNIAFLATRDTGLKILNISNLTSPQLLSTYPANGTTYSGLTIFGNIVFIASSTVGLQIVDVSDLMRPKLLSTYKTAGATNNVVVSGNTAFVAAYSLQILNVTNFSNPQLLSTYPAGQGLAYGVTISGNTVFVANSLGGIQILDVSNLTNPRLLGTYPAGSGSDYDVFVSGKTALVANGPAGLQILGLSTWELALNPTDADVGNYALSLTATDIAGDSVSKTFTIRIEGPPQLHNPLPSQYAKVGQVFYYITPPNTFIDPNFDPLVFSVSTLPAWLNFDSISTAFTGTPSANDAGVFTVQLTATDPLGGTASDRFNITVTYIPIVNNPLTQTLNLIQGRYFTYSVPVSTFYGYGEKLNYTISNSGDDGLLPAWINFIPENATLFGIPTSTGVVTLRVIAQNSANNQASTPLNLIITANIAPQLNQPISTQTAQVGQPFQFFVPTNTFADKDGDILTYSASFLGDSTSFAWLTFDPKTVSFKGTPGRSDTNAFSIRVLNILLTASDADKASANTVFNLNVDGTSNWALFVKIASPLVSVVTAAFTFYKKRALCFNRYKPHRYNRLKEEAIVGEAYIRKLDTPANEIAVVRAKLPAGKRNCCVKFFKSPRVNLPGGQLLPAWLIYDHRKNALVSKSGPEDTDIAEDLIIQVKDHADVIREQFTLKVVPKNVLDDNQVEAERKDDIPLQVMH